jgi:uncharacterized protein YecT (DUF1311 family)
MFSVPRSCIAALVLIAPCPVGAESNASADCSALITGAEQKECAELAFRTSADELKDAYRRVLERSMKADGSMPNGSGEKNWTAVVTKSQQAWENYRDAECWGVVGLGEGSGRMVWVWGCLAEKNKERIRELNVPFYQR